MSAPDRGASSSEDFRDEVRDIVRALHGDCADRGCDIREALEAEFPLVAGWLLMQATETPELDRIVAAYGVPTSGVWGWAEDECADWLEHYRSAARRCKRCGGATFADDEEPATCASCLAPLPGNQHQGV